MLFAWYTTAVLLDACPTKQVDEQLVGRLYRAGQKRNVHIHRLVMEGTLESRMHQMWNMLDTEPTNAGQVNIKRRAILGKLGQLD